MEGERSRTTNPFLIPLLLALLLPALAILTGCADEGTAPEDTGAEIPATARPGSSSADSEVARRSVMEADRAFGRAFAERGPEVWPDFFAPDGIQIPGGLPAARGRDEVRQLSERIFGAPGFRSMTWEPVEARVAASGDLAYTLGNYVVESYVAESVDHEAEPVRREGNYVTIWRRAADGTWQVAVDIGNAGPPLRAPVRSPPE